MDDIRSGTKLLSRSNIRKVQNDYTLRHYPCRLRHPYPCDKTEQSKTNENQLVWNFFPNSTKLLNRSACVFRKDYILCRFTRWLTYAFDNNQLNDSILHAQVEDDCNLRYQVQYEQSTCNPCAALFFAIDF